MGTDMTTKPKPVKLPRKDRPRGQFASAWDVHVGGERVARCRSLAEAELRAAKRIRKLGPELGKGVVIWWLPNGSES